MGTNLKRIAVLAVGAVLALSACGGDDSDDVSADAVESLPSDATDGGADATDAPSGTEATGDTAGDIELDGEFCSATAQMMERFDDMETSMSTGDSIAGLSEAFATLGETVGALDELQGTAPDELKDDVATLTEAFGSFQDNLPELQQFAEDLEDAGTDPTKLGEVAENYEDLMTTVDLSALSSPEVEEAGDNVRTYVRDVCGLDTGS